MAHNNNNNNNISSSPHNIQLIGFLPVAFPSIVTHQMTCVFFNNYYYDIPRCLCYIISRWSLLFVTFCVPLCALEREMRETAAHWRTKRKRFSRLRDSCV